MDETAIPLGSSAFSTPLPEHEELVELSDEDKAIAGLMSVPSWGVYESKVRAKLDALRASIDTAKLSLEEIGKRYVVISSVIQLVEETLLQVKAQAQAVYDNEQRARDEAGA